MTIVDFVLERIAETESVAEDMRHQAALGRPFFTLDDNVGGTGIRALIDPTRVLAECAAKRAIVELHQQWPVFVEKAPTYNDVALDVNEMAFRATREILWLTEQEYRKRFGDEPPTTPMMKALAAIYSDHHDYDPEWA